MTPDQQVRVTFQPNWRVAFALPGTKILEVAARAGLASRKERQSLAGPEKIHWLSPGWLKHWDFIFKDWDVGKANEMFPAHDKAVVLDALGYFDKLMEESPERILAISDWMRLPIEALPVSLERLKGLLTACLNKDPL